MHAPELFGWDIGGAHVKACRTVQGAVLDVVQWACPLWQGLEHLDRVLQLARERWPRLCEGTHAVTMTGEMVDLFAHREDGVQRIAGRLADGLAPAEPRFFAGNGVSGQTGDDGSSVWFGAAQAAAHWEAAASANWLATARHVALRHPQAAGVLVDIGSTTTDLIAFRGGRVLTASRSDADRLASGELVYQGVVRTPLCALAPRIAWRGRPLNVMNEFFATVADVYRLTGELEPAHDLHPTADNAAKDLPATRQRLARMIGLDARDGSTPEWRDVAVAWRACQIAEIAGQLQRVLALHGLAGLQETAVIVSAGCGDFLVPDLAARVGLDRCLSYGLHVARVARVAPVAAEAGTLAAWAQVCAPCIAVAALLHLETR